MSTTTASDLNLLYGELRQIEARIKKINVEHLVANWEFGHALIQRRVRGRLPKGLRAEISEQFVMESSEITWRMRLADTYATREEIVRVFGEAS